MTLNALTLLALLPLVARLHVVSASPLRDESLHQKRTTGDTVAPLGFQQVSDSMGISAQMVSLLPRHQPPPLMNR